MEKQVRVYKEALTLSSWADLFGFNLDMGQDGEPFVEVDGVRYTDADAEKALTIAAQAMGMKEERLHGV